MKTINLRRISETLGEKELKNVTGGSVGNSGLDARMVMPDDMEVGNGGYTGPKYKACEGKKLCDPCYYKVSGHCSSWPGQPLHCSDLRCFH